MPILVIGEIGIVACDALTPPLSMPFYDFFMEAVPEFLLVAFFVDGVDRAWITS